MDEKTKEVLISLIETLRENSFDICFCLEVLKRDKEIAKLYEICKKRFDEQIASGNEVVDNNEKKEQKEE